MKKNLMEKQSFFSLLKKELKLTEQKELNLVVKIIIIEKFLKGLILLLLSFSFVPIFSDDVINVLQNIARRSHLLSNARFFLRMLDNFGALSDKRLLTASIFFLFWGVVELTESFGLTKRRRWAEYLVVISTGLFIPIEVYTTINRFTFEKLGILIFNIFLIIYFIWSRKLFTFEELKEIEKGKHSQT